MCAVGENIARGRSLKGKDPLGGMKPWQERPLKLAVFRSVCPRYHLFSAWPKTIWGRSLKGKGHSEALTGKETHNFFACSLLFVGARLAKFLQLLCAIRYPSMNPFLACSFLFVGGRFAKFLQLLCTTRYPIMNPVLTKIIAWKGKTTAKPWQERPLNFFARSFLFVGGQFAKFLQLLCATRELGKNCPLAHLLHVWAPFFLEPFLFVGTRFAKFLQLLCTTRYPKLWSLHDQKSAWKGKTTEKPWQERPLNFFYLLFSVCGGAVNNFFQVVAFRQRLPTSVAPSSPLLFIFIISKPLLKSMPPLKQNSKGSRTGEKTQST